MNDNPIQIDNGKIKTLLFLVTTFPPEVSGASFYNWERAVWLSKQGLYRVVVLAPDWQVSKAGRRYPEQIPANLTIDCYPSKPWFFYSLTHVPKIAAFAYINRRLAAYKPDLVVMTDAERLFSVTTWQLPGKTYAKQHRIPFLAEFQTDLYNFSAAYPGGRFLRSIIQRTQLGHYLYREFNYTICTSEAARKSCTEMGITNTKLLPFLGINVADYSPTLRNRASLAPWIADHEKDHVIFLFLGRLGYEKRVDLLIRAFAQIKQLHPGSSLIIAGDGPEIVVRQLKHQAAAIADIHFTGFIMGAAKARVLAACDIFCSPSPFETFGRTVVEAMAAGLPVVTVKSGAVTEYIHHGVNGFLVPPDDVHELARIMAQILTTDLHQLIRRACRDAQQFSIKHGCQKLSDFYQQVLAERNSSS